MAEEPQLIIAMSNEDSSAATNNCILGTEYDSDSGMK
jgi:hypothetical protein